MTQSNSDTIEGAAYVAVFLVIMFVASRIMVRFNTARFNRAFQPLVGIINGRLRSGGEQSMMEGTYGGRNVLVAVSHDVTTHAFTGHPNTKRNLMEISVTPLTGANDWQVVYKSFDGSDWRATSTNDVLAQHLTDAGAVELVKPMGIFSYVTYSAHFQTLTYTQDIRPNMAPSPHHLESVLQLLANLDTINSRVNQA